MLFRAFLAAALFSAAIPVLATPQPIDATDLWINPAESGWGLSVFHQGDTLFASLFVYGPDNQPKWYTASSLTGGPNVYTGALTEATGPYFGAQAQFDPNAVTRRTVGTMTITLTGSGGSVDYTVDGTRVTKDISRFSMRPINISGQYYAVEMQPANVAGTEVVRPDQHLSIGDAGTAVPQMSSGSNTTSSCNFNVSSRTQDGETVALSGTANCGASNGPFSMSVDPTPHGFVGSFSGIGISQGRIAAARSTAPDLQATGYINDLWFPANEAGWGLNLIEQGDTAFATLFVFDAQNRPHWYSASQLVASTQNGRPAWSGSLEESTGPYFGGAFNASQVSRHVVGTMSLGLTENGVMNLSYDVGGLRVVKSLNRFAFRKNDLSGSYRGHVVMRTDDPRGLSYDDATFTINDQDGTVTMAIAIATGPTCNFNGQAIQYGSQRSMYGTYLCQGGATGSFELNDLMVTADGLTGTYSGPAGHIGGSIANGHISGARR